MSNNKPSAVPATAAPDDLERESAPREEEDGTVSAAASNDTAVHEQQEKIDGDADAAIIASAASPSRRSKQFTMAQTPRHCNTNKARGGNNINNNKHANHQDDNDDGDKDDNVGMKGNEGEDKASTLIPKTKMVREENLLMAAAVTISQASPPSVTNRATVAGGGTAAATNHHHQRHPSNNLESSLLLSLSSSSFSPTFYNTKSNNENQESGHHHQLQTTDASVLHDHDPRRSDPRRLLAHEHPLQQPNHPHTHHQFPHLPHHPPQRHHPAVATATYPDDSNHAPVSSSLACYPPPPHPRNSNHIGDSLYFRHGAGASGRHHHHQHHPFHQQQQQQYRRVEHHHAASTTASSLSSRYYDHYPLPPPPPPPSSSSSYYHESLSSSAPSSRMHHHQPPPGYYYNDHPRYHDPSPHPSYPPRDYYDYYSATTDMDSHPPPSTSQLHQQSHHRNHHYLQHQLNPNNYPASSLGDEDAFRECDANNRCGGGHQQKQQEQQQRHRGLSTMSEDGSKENTNCGGDDGNTSLHAVSSSFSNGTKDITNTIATTASTSTNSTTTILSLVPDPAKYSPGIVTNHHRTGGCSLEGTDEEYNILQQESSLSMMSSSMSLPNQPSLKSTNDGQNETDHTTNHDNNNDAESTSNSSWRILQQIASVDKDEMLRFQTSKSELTVATATTTSTAMETGDVVNDEDTKKNNALAQSAGLATTTPNNKKEMPSLTSSGMMSATATARSHGEGTLISSEREIGHNKAVGNITNNTNNNKIIKQESPGELLPATSNLSRTSSLSDSPAADDDNEDDNDVHGEGGVDHEDENCREVGEPSNSYPPRSGNTMHPPRSSLLHHHHYPHLPPHHQHHSPYCPYMRRAATMVSESRSHLPPASLHPLRLSELEMFSDIGAGGLERGAAATNGEDEFSPSASTISTKASLVLAKTTHHHHPAGKNNCVGVKEDGAQGGVTKQFVSNKYPPTPNMKPKHPVHVKKSREVGCNRADSNGNNHGFESSSSDQHDVAKQGKHCDASPEIIMESTTGNAPPPSLPPPPPKGDSPTVALDGCVMASSLGDDESPTTASAAASSHHSQQSLELGAMPSWETAGKPLAGWSICSGMESLKEAVMGSAFSFSGTIEDDSAMNNDDPSPKSILSKLGEKRRIAPGTHVQFSRDNSESNNRYEYTASSTPAGGGGGGSRKRNHGSVGWSQEPPPHSPRQLYDDYYYREGPPPRHSVHHYDQYGDYRNTPHHPPPPSHRYLREHAFHPEEDPYYDHYYSTHPPPPPPPYGYPPHPRHVTGRPTHRPEYPPYPTNSMPPHHSPAVMGGRNNLMVHTPPSTIHHPALIHSQFSHNRAVTSVVGNGISYGAWTQEDDAALMELMKKVKSPENWDPIAKKLDRGKSPREIQERWTRFLKPGSRKGQWTEEEDAVVIEAVGNSIEDPFTRWSDLAQRLPGRVGKQVRDRWVNHLNPAISHLPFGREDDLLLWEGHNDVGKRWVEISCKYFKATRSENHIKNRWYSASFKKFIAKEFGPDAYRLANEIGGNGRNMASMADSHHQPPLKQGAPIVSGYKVSAHNVMSS